MPNTVYNDLLSPMELLFSGHCNSLFFRWGEDRGTNAPWQTSVSSARRVTVQQKPEIRARVPLADGLGAGCWVALVL